MANKQSLSITLHTSINEIGASDWDTLTDKNPLLSHAYFLALEQSHSVGKNTGWHPYHLTAYNQEQQLVGAMPLYLKTHSYGEYVFDWAWAEAYERNQLAYYPKLVSAIPFTPVTGARLLCQNDDVCNAFLETISEVLASNQLSSAHVLFPNENNAKILESAGWLKRKGVQFRWQNHGYQNMDAFLATLSHDKRKKIKQDRKKIADAKIDCEWILGGDASKEDWDFFYACYCNTYNLHHSTPYLTRAFFSQVATALPNNCLLILAKQDGKPIAAALNFFNQQSLYGRYWGAIQFYSGLHFELCYYQAQEFCIANGITFFEGGAQGEHKLARGFEPRATCSYHKICNPEFKEAIAQFLMAESKGITAYTNELEERIPFKQASPT
jgi:uncharacterized protein